MTIDNKHANKWYVNDRILESLSFTDYVLPSGSLTKFKRNLVDSFNEKSAYFEFIIDLYKDMHRWSFKHSKQPSIVKEGKTYFSEITTLEQAYWLGFLLAESHIAVRGGNRRFQLSVSSFDGATIKKFAKAIGFDLRKVKYNRKVSTKSGKTLREFSIGFSNKKFYDALVEYGFPLDGKTSNNPDLRFLYEAFDDKRFVMAMLLGFFDGDGTHGLAEPNQRISDKRLAPVIKISRKQ